MIVTLSTFTLLGCSTVYSLTEAERVEKLQRGVNVYQVNCVSCHGTDLLGTNQGPPLLWDLYVSNHHPDKRMALSISDGVSQHHWRYGDMPAQTHLNETEVDDVVFFIRQNLNANVFR